MAAIDDLIAQISDEGLRDRIQKEVERMNKHKKFGLVFEEHKPECTPLYDIKVTVGSNVMLKNDTKIENIFKVVAIKNGIAYCVKESTDETAKFNIDEVVCVAQFGEPIYPYLKPIDSVCNAPNDELWHTLIEADNYHALQLLEYLYAGKVDCIYIDPPYNTGATDWKYNNDYVDSNDAYKHSKWLSFMEKRLKLAKKLLNPNDSILIVTIDDKEYLHLGCLIEEMFAGNKITMISSVINPVGKGKKGGIDFSKTDEYIYYVQIGNASIQPEVRETSPIKIRWQTFRRSSLANGRGKHGVGACGPNQFFPIYVNNKTLRVQEVGYPIAENVDRFSVKQIEGCTTVFPVRKDGTEINWGATRERVLELLEKGYFKVASKLLDEPQQYKIKYLTKGVIKDIEDGKIIITGKDEYGGVTGYYDVGKELMPTTNWNKPTHNATSNGTDLLTKIFIKSPFDYAKSLYAVSDCLKIAVANKPNALVLDFFAGSGTTLHAVNLINKEDSGSRRCILVTNNEVSKEEADLLKQANIELGTDEYSSHGIARSITWPRNVLAIKGINANGDPLEGNYITNKKRLAARKRSIKKVSFFENFEDLTIAEKKQVVSMLTSGSFPLKQIKGNSTFALDSDDKSQYSILFDTEDYLDWIDALLETENVTNLIVLTKEIKTFNAIKKELELKLGDYSINEPILLPMSEGFKTNANFFKLGFLNKTSVALGMQLQELIPVLWMKANAIGECPIDVDVDKDMIVLPKNKMAILIDENSFSKFKEELDNHPEIETAFIIADYEAGYQAMANKLNVKYSYQLYKDYLDNFRINQGR